MNVLFLTMGVRKTPSTRFRVKQYLNGLIMDGFNVTVLPIPHNLHKRFALLRHIYNHDIVVIQKKLFSIWELTLIRRINPVLIYDFDDNVVAEHPKHPASEKLLRILKKREKRFEAILKASKMIIAGNSFLKEKALSCNKNVEIIPTPIDVDIYRPGNKLQKEEVVIGWIGTRSNLFYLDDIKKAIQLVGDKYGKRAIFKVVCDQEYAIDGVNTAFKKWVEEDEVADLQSFDIGIMPLTDDDWSKGKCGFKILQYMSVGLPVVASPVGANRDIVHHGCNGFLARTIDEWVDYLSRLIDDKSLRERLGNEGRKMVEDRYSVNVCLNPLEEVFRQLYSNQS